MAPWPCSVCKLSLLGNESPWVGSTAGDTTQQACKRGRCKTSLAGGSAAFQLPACTLMTPMNTMHGAYSYNMMTCELKKIESCKISKWCHGGRTEPKDHGPNAPNDWANTAQARITLGRSELSNITIYGCCTWSRTMQAEHFASYCWLNIPAMHQSLFQWPLRAAWTCARHCLILHVKRHLYAN